MIEKLHKHRLSLVYTGNNSNHAQSALAWLTTVFLMQLFWSSVLFLVLSNGVFFFLILCSLLFDSTVYFQEARSALIFLYFINGRTNYEKRVLVSFWFFHQELRLSKSIGGNFHKSIRQYSTFRETLKSLFSQCSFQSHHSCHHSAYSFDRMRGYFPIYWLYFKIETHFRWNTEVYSLSCGLHISCAEFQ